MRQRSMRSTTRACALAVGISSALSVLLGLPASAAAAVWTDRPSYAPGAAVTISGDNSDGVGYMADEQISVGVSAPSGQAASCSATADSFGAWSCQVTLASDTSAIGSYSYTATGQASGVSQSGSFTDSGCPNSKSLESHKNEDPNVSASYTTSGGEATYSFKSSNESPVGGVPGLIEYCVYTSPLPDSTAAVYSNLHGAWGTGSGGGFFDFERSDGNPDNLPFDGSTQTVGTATWTSGNVPAAQTILLHINDSAECTALEGKATETCFVRPGKEAAAARDLTATKTANPAFARTYKWGISKTVNKAEIDTASATFNYTVSVTHDAGADTGWKVAGDISVSNPNGAAVSGVDVTDAINDANASCSVVGGSGATIAPEGVVKFPYSCTYSAAPKASSETNTATVKWSTQELSDGSTLTGNSTTATAPVDWSSTTPTIIDGSVSVSDTFGGSLGTVSYAQASPTKFLYSHTFTGDPIRTCTTHENTATFTTSDSDTTGSASQTVMHCRPGVKSTITCTSVTYVFTGFPNLNNNTVKERIKVDGIVIYTGTFTFNGRSGSNTVKITLSPGHHEITAFAIWKTNGVQGEGDNKRAGGITCE